LYVNWNGGDAECALAMQSHIGIKSQLNKSKNGLGDILAEIA